MDTGVLGGVQTFFCLDDARIVTKGGFEFVVGLCAQFVAITQKKSRFRQLTSLAREMSGDCGVALPL